MEQLDTTPQDWFNHIAQGLTTNALIQYVIEPDGRIDDALLSKAVWLASRVEPVLGCVFEEKDPMPVWTPVAKNSPPACVLVKTQHMEEEVTAILAKDLDVAAQPPITVFLVDDTRSNVLIVKINHAACDGIGSKYYLRLLAEMYTRLEDDASFIPPAKTPVRDTRSFYRALGIEDIAGYFNPGKAELTSSWEFPSGKGAHAPQRFFHRLLRYRPDEYRKMRQYAKNQGVTVNAFLTAAYFTALTGMVAPDEARKELQFMVDLRKYLPPGVAQTVCNLSAILNIELSTTSNHFSDLVRQVNESTKEALASDRFIHGTIAGDLAGESGYNTLTDLIKADWASIRETVNCTPMISNLGLFDTANMKFGKTQIKDIYLVSPAFYAPAFMLGVSTCNHVLTICASYYHPGIHHEDIDKLLDRIDSVVTSI